MTISGASYGVDVKFRPSLVRGLSYYNGSVFETQAIAGGSYLINNIQSTGISFGVERLCMLAKIKTKKEKILVVSLSKNAEAIKLAQELRNSENSVTIYYGKPSKALEYANSYKIQKAVFVGKKEVKLKTFKVKDLKTGKESILKI